MRCSSAPPVAIRGGQSGYEDFSLAAKVEMTQFEFRSAATKFVRRRCDLGGSPQFKLRTPKVNLDAQVLPPGFCRLRPEVPVTVQLRGRRGGAPKCRPTLGMRLSEI